MRATVHFFHIVSLSLSPIPFQGNKEMENWLDGLWLGIAVVTMHAVPYGDLRLIVSHRLASIERAS